PSACCRPNTLAERPFTSIVRRTMSSAVAPGAAWPEVAATSAIAGATRDRDKQAAATPAAVALRNVRRFIAYSPFFAARYGGADRDKSFRSSAGRLRKTIV